MWVLDAERVARLAERLDEAASVPLPESGPLRARALLDVAEVAEARNALDRYLEGPEDDVET